MGVVTKEVTRGVFDPRTYREDDPVNWARKRRSDWLAVPGKIHFVRERTVDKKTPEQAAEPSPDREVVKMPPKEIPIKSSSGDRKQSNDYWPRKMRSDITRSRVI